MSGSPSAPAAPNVGAGAVRGETVRAALLGDDYLFSGAAAGVALALMFAWFAIAKRFRRQRQRSPVWAPPPIRRKAIATLRSVENPLRSPSIDARGSPALQSSPRHPRARSGATPESSAAAPPLSPRARNLAVAVRAPASPLARPGNAAAAALLAIVATNPLLATVGGSSPKRGAARPGKGGKASSAPSPLSLKGRASGISSPTTLRSIRSSGNMSFLDLGAAAEAAGEELEALPGSGAEAPPLAFSNPLLAASARRLDGTTARTALRASGGGKGGTLE